MVLLAITTFAQQYRFRPYGAQQGFMSRGAETMAQDSSGFIWIGAHNGLFKFDGVKTISWNFSSIQGEKVLQVRVSDLLIDKKDKIWLATNVGLVALEPVTREISVYNDFTGNEGLLQNIKLNNLATDNQGNIYGVTDAGVFMKQSSDSVLRRISIAGLPEDQSFFRNSIDSDEKGDIYISLQNRIYRKLSTERKFSLFKEITETALKDISKIKAGKNTIWCGNFDHSVLMGVDKKTRTYSEYIIQKDESPEEPNSLVMSICEINDSTVWTGSYIGYGNSGNSGGVSVIHLRSRKVDRIFANGAIRPAGLRNGYVECIFQDRQGSIWVTGIDGIDQYHPAFNEFTIYQPTLSNDKYGIPPSGISDIEADDAGNIWIASKSNGLARINIKGEVEERIPIEKTHLDQSGFIFGVLACGPDGKLYISSTQYVYEVDTKLPNAFDRKHRIVKSGFHGGVTHMLVDNEKNLWIGTHLGGLYKVSPNGEEEHYCDNGDAIHRLPSGGVLGLEHSGDSILVSIGSSGVYILRKGLTPIESLSAKALQAKGWKKGKIREIKITPEWIFFGMKDLGLQYINRENGKLYSLTTNEGLLSNTITGIEIDFSGIVWIANDVGLQRFNPKSGELTSYTAQRTLPETGFFNGAHAISTNGTVYFANFGHLISITSSNKTTAIPLQLQLFSVKVNGHEILKGNKIDELPYDQNTIQFSFSSQNFLNPEDDQYEYFLEGFSSEWLPVESERMLIFTNLKGGSYNLKLKVSNSNLGKAAMAFPFYIKTAFYNTWWFRILIAIFIIGLIYLAYSFRIRQLTRLHQLRNEISSDLHDDIGSTLSSVYYSAELLQQQGEHHPELRNKIANNISTNTRELVERMRDIVWSIHPDNDALPEMVARMREYINRLDLSENLQVNFDCESHALKNIALNMKARRNLYLVFKEATNNAIKYSKGTSIQIQLKVNNNQLHLSVTDNGHGFDPDKVSAGNGLRTMKQRIEEIGGIYQITQLNPGTEIIAIVPAD